MFPKSSSNHDPIKLFMITINSIYLCHQLIFPTYTAIIVFIIITLWLCIITKKFPQQDSHLNNCKTKYISEPITIINLADYSRQISRHRLRNTSHRNTFHTSIYYSLPSLEHMYLISSSRMQPLWTTHRANLTSQMPPYHKENKYQGLTQNSIRLEQIITFPIPFPTTWTFFIKPSHCKATLRGINGKSKVQDIGTLKWRIYDDT